MKGFAWRTDPSLALTAKAKPREIASTAMLGRNGQFSGETKDDAIGLAWGRLLQP